MKHHPHKKLRLNRMAFGLDRFFLTGSVGSSGIFNRRLPFSILLHPLLSCIGFFFPPARSCSGCEALAGKPRPLPSASPADYSCLRPPPGLPSPVLRMAVALSSRAPASRCIARRCLPFLSCAWPIRRHDGLPPNACAGGGPMAFPSALFQPRQGAFLTRHYRRRRVGQAAKAAFR